MKTLLLLGALFICATAISRPLVIENNSALPPYAEDFAFAGDELMSTRVGYSGGTPPEEEYDYYVELYRRGSNGEWTLARELVREHSTEDGGASVSMTSTVAAIGLPSGLQIWERTSSGWVRGKLDPSLQVGGALAIAGNTILASVPSPGPNFCSERAAVLTRGTSGIWGMSAELDVAPGVCVTSGALDNGRAILGAQDRDDTIAIDRAFVFETSGSAWNLVATLSPNDGSTKFAGRVAIRRDVAIVSANKRGSHVYERNTVGWQLVAFLPNEDTYDGSQEDYDLAMNDEFVVKAGTNINRQSSVAYVYRRLTNRTFEHVANLDTRYGISQLHIEGRRVIGGNVDLFEFNLPMSFSVLTPVQDDFESGASAAWMPTPGSQFTVVSNGQTHVYRQTHGGDADAIYSLDLHNQHVSADFRINAFSSSSERWLGLVTRYTSPGNYYYVTLRSPGNRLVLKRMLNGVFTEMASYSMPATLGWHRLGLESTGTLHNVYVDGVRVAYARDASHTHGRSGFRMHNLSADVDNYVVTPGPLARQDSTDRVASGGVWDGNWVRGGSTFIQTSPDAGDARALSGLPRKDGVVQANVTFNAGSSSGTPWVGLIVRYVDSRNYYYVTMRSNELSLRKLTNGAITVLDSEPYSRQAGVPVKMRLEAVRDRVRVFVNDELRLETSGASIVAGKVGLMTYKASATFENYLAYEP